MITVGHADNRRTGVIAAVITGLVAASATVITAAPAAAVTGFTAGDVVVYRIGDGGAALTSGGTPIFLDEYSPAGALVQSIALPSSTNGANKRIVASGTAGSEGLLGLSADSRYLVAPGYNAAVGTTGLSGSASASVPRTVARVGATGAVDTTTSLTDFADGNNPRSVTSADGGQFWVGGAAGGVRYATLGASTSTSLTSSTYKNVRQVQDIGGQLYTSGDPTKAGVTVATVGTGLPTSGTQNVTNLNFGSAPTDPYGYSLLTLADSGSGPDTLYVADNTAGAVVKYSLSSGSWVRKGSVAVTAPSGLTANDVNGTVTIYATGNGGGIYKITDTSGLGGTLSGSANLIGSAPANEAFRGVAFAPGTVIGSGGGQPANPPPTITPDRTGLPAALGDPSNPTLPVTVADTSYPANELSVTATSSKQSVAADNGITISGSGASRTLSVTPGVVGNATITLTVTAPDATSSTTQIRYAVSADIGASSARYYTGAGNASAAVDLGNGYVLLCDDENNVLRLYQTDTSGPPVKTFDFSSVLPYGSVESDLETAARSGDVIYWGGSLSNTSGGNQAPSRSTIFATRVTGSGANTTLTYLGSYTGLKSDLISWDRNNGHGLGADYLGLSDSAATGVDGHESNALNIEGMEFASDGSTAYLSFRAPLEPTDNRHLALLVPLTNVNAITTSGNPGSMHATFGAPIFLNLGGLGVRDIKRNADGQFLIIAGTADDTNSSFVLYNWDGNPGDPPQPSGTTLPQLPSADNAGSWETIVSVPQPLSSGSSLQLVQDDGGVAWYGDGLTSKNGLPADLQKSVGVTFTYSAPAARDSTTTLSADSTSSVAGVAVTYTATVAPASGGGSPTGTVAFTEGGDAVSGCASQPVSAGSATCTVAFTAAGPHTVTATYSGSDAYTGSDNTLDHTVTVAAVRSLTVSPAHAQISAGGSKSFAAEGFDRYGNDIGDVTADTTFALTPGSDGGGCSGNTCTATAADDYTVAAGDGPAVGSASLDVVPGSVAALVVTPATSSTAAGDDVEFSAEGRDSYGNSTGDQTAATTFTITPTGGGSADGATCSGAACSATAAGVYTIAASVPTIPGTATGNTTLTVTAGPLAKLSLTPPTATIDAGDTQTYTATGIDRFGNPTGDVTSDTTFSISGTGTCSATSCGSTDPGGYTVTGTDGSATGTATLTVTAVTPPTPPPAISALSPNTGPPSGMTTVTVSGSGFDGATRVQFGPVAASDFTVISDTEISVFSPQQAAGTRQVYVYTAAGRSAAVSGSRFFYRTTPPVVTRSLPKTGPANGGTAVTITGRNLAGTTEVDFGDTPATDVTVVSATEVRAVSPALTPDTYDITVTAGAGTSATTTAARFTATAVAPAVSAINPRSGSTAGGTTVTISGARFTGTTEVDFGSAPATSLSVVSATRISAVSPAGAAGAVQISVTTSAGTSSGGSAAFTYVIPKPTVTSLTPGSGTVSGGTRVTISGAALSGATRVSFGDVAASDFTVVSDSRITATVPAQHRGSYHVVVTTAQGSSAARTGSTFRYDSDAPAITGLSPDSGATTGGDTVTISGVRFAGASGVRFGTRRVTNFEVVSDSMITAVVPAQPAGVVDVHVDGPGGASFTASSDRYTYS